MKLSTSITILLIIFSITACQEKENMEMNKKAKLVAQTPPMGWNSYDAYHAAITENQFLEIVDTLSSEFLPYGWEYAVIDYCWFHPGPEGWDPQNDWHTFDISQTRDRNGALVPRMTMDKYGRLLPAINRFPSAANGVGFKKIAEYVHSKGMKFGIHIMRGIPRQAVEDNCQILGTNYNARDIAFLQDTCTWLNTMYGVDSRKPGAQEYYNSLFKLYAEWGVDFIKADDMMVPKYHSGEIEMMRKAIYECGCPMVLSLSCGEAIISQAKHLVKNANMWRISIDFWDRWKDLKRMFDLTSAWSPFIGKGTWPDNDMIPFGKLCLTGFPVSHNNPHSDKIEHESNFTETEHVTLMNLWSITKSPLIWGGDPLTSSEWSKAFLKNKEVIYVNQNSINNRLLYHGYGDSDCQIWIADDPVNKDKFIAMFNSKAEPQDITFTFFYADIYHSIEFRDLWLHKNVGTFESTFTQKIEPHGSRLYRLHIIDD